VVCTGFFSNDKQGIPAAGTFYSKFDGKNGNVIQKDLKLFSSTELNALSSVRQDQNERSLENIAIRDVIASKGGGSVIFAEQCYIVEISTTTDRGIPLLFYEYYYNDIILIKINKNGTIGWVYRIPKRQETDNSYLFSFADCLYNDKIVCIYNDHRKNEQQTDVSKLKSMTDKRNNSEAMVAVVDSNGNYTKAPLFQGKEKKTKLWPLANIRTADNRLVIFAMKKKNYGFVTVNIK
jgi:hypothetical protein